MRRRSALRFATVSAVSWVMAAGCGSASDYYDVQEAWTRHEKAYDVFDTRAHVYATLKTEPFRRAYVEEYARLFELTPEQKRVLVEAELAEHQQSWVVIAAFYTVKRQWNDLDPKRGFWEVRLQGPDGAHVRPSKVTRLARDNPTWEVLYPYNKPHYTLYELRFDRATPSGALGRPGEHIELIVAGAPTSIALGWQMPVR